MIAERDNRSDNFLMMLSSDCAIDCLEARSGYQMKIKKMRFLGKILAGLSYAVALSMEVNAGEPPVTVSDDGAFFTMANGAIVARIQKDKGEIVSLRFNGTELAKRGYWSQVGKTLGRDIGTFGTKRPARISFNSEERGQVSCGFEYDKRSGLPCDVEIQYTLLRGVNGLYACAIWEHKAGYREFSVGEARFAMKLNADAVDYLGIDSKRKRIMPSGSDWDNGEETNVKEARRMTTGIHKGEVEHKYDYSAILAETPAYGWAGTKSHAGLWLINPSIEYLAGGPTKVELTGHLDVNPGGAPTLLNMWHGSHYGGSSLSVAENENWRKVIGPFLLYCNDGAEAEKLFEEAVDYAKKERTKWPYEWAEAAPRGGINGRIVLEDDSAKINGRIQVGLAWGDWQRDSKHYQFWTHADDEGNFSIKNARTGEYTLFAFANGILGEFSLANVKVEADKSINLGELKWKPVRFGKQIWEIGIPDRSAAEFRHGDDYWHWGLYNLYTKEFPDDVNFIIGKSDWKTNWNYAQPPRLRGSGRGEPSVWTVQFEMDDVPKGKATLRLGIAGARIRGGIEVGVNGESAGSTERLPDTGVMHRDGIRGYWVERNLSFDASKLKKGTNKLTLRTGGTQWVQGVLYDYLRLELAE